MTENAPIRPYETVEQMLSHAGDLATQLAAGVSLPAATLVSDLISEIRGMRRVYQSPSASEPLAFKMSPETVEIFDPNAGADAVAQIVALTSFSEAEVRAMIENGRSQQPIQAHGTVQSNRATATYAEETPDAPTTIETLVRALDAYPSDTAARDELSISLGDRPAQRLIAAIRNAQKEIS